MAPSTRSRSSRASDPRRASCSSARAASRATCSPPRPATGDLVVVGGAGAYCAAMCTGNYNSYPLAPEVLRELDGSLRLVRRRQSLEQMLANEVEEARAPSQVGA